MSLFEFLKPKWQRSDPNVRKVGVAKLTNVSTLVRIQEEDPSSDVRRVALEKLIEIAKDSKHWLYSYGDICIRRARDAIQVVNDEATLMDIASNAKVIGIAACAVAKIACERVLADILLTFNGHHPDVFFTVMKRIKDQEILLEIANCSKIHTSPRILAVRSLSSQQQIMDLAANADETGVRYAAITKVSDQGFLARLAASESDINVSTTTINTMNQKDLLKKIAKENPRVEVRCASILRLIDIEAEEKGTGPESSRHDQESDRARAIRSIQDQEVLAHLALKEREEIALAAVEVITDQSLLVKIAEEYAHNRNVYTVWRVRDAAIKRLEDRNLAAELHRAVQARERAYQARMSRGSPKAVYRETCPMCGGRGYLIRKDPAAPPRATCPRCKGSGKVRTDYGPPIPPLPGGVR